MGDWDDLQNGICCSCSHLKAAHRRSGSCTAGSCMCGWWQDPEGVIRERSTGIAAIEIREKSWRTNRPLYEQKLIGKACYYCGKFGNTVDHVVPKCRGGGGVGNVVSACKRCNNLKGGLTEEEFVEYTCNLMWEDHEEERKL